ncbi:MAG: Phosphoribosylamine--glycine ligase [Elusimicrobia bacterium]|nr:Phosphoribosylamine--glycine ligase [Elusimicrobiota bacterium]
MHCKEDQFLPHFHYMGGDKINGNGKKFLFVSEIGCIGDLAYVVKNEGHQVRYHIGDKHEKNVSDGFVDKVDDWEKHADWADVIIFDDIGFGGIAERLRKEGKKVVGGTPFSDKLEFDRDLAQEELRKVGINTLPCWDFTSFDEALKFVKGNPGRYVVKPNGKAQDEKVLSFVGQEEDGLDLVNMLERYKTGWGSKIRSFQLQKFVAGVEVAIGAFFNGQEFILPACINFEHKRMFNDEIGPTTGEMGTTIMWAGPNRLYNETLKKFEKRLAEIGFIGYFDINCIVNSRGIYPLEITPRFGYPTINIQMEGVASRWSDLLFALANRQPFQLKTNKGYQVGVVIAVPPYPYDDPDVFEKFSDDAVIIFKKQPLNGIHHCDVRLVDGDWRIAGSSGYVLVVTGSGATMSDAQKETYNRIKNIILPNMFYRTDIGNRWSRDGDLLQTWGLLAG